MRASTFAYRGDVDGELILAIDSDEAIAFFLFIGGDGAGPGGDIFTGQVEVLADMAGIECDHLVGGKVVTGDYNLNKMAKIHGVPVINLNDVANALKPVYLPGEQLEVRIVKAGEEPGQGVGYLQDGTMVVVDEGNGFINREIQVVVTSILQTNTGRMVFGRPAESNGNAAPANKKA